MTARAPAISLFRGSITRLQHWLFTLRAALSDDYAKLASGGGQPFPGGIPVYPLSSCREFWVFRDPPLSLGLSWRDRTFDIASCKMSAFCLRACLKMRWSMLALMRDGAVECGSGPSESKLRHWIPCVRSHPSGATDRGREVLRAAWWLESQATQHCAFQAVQVDLPIMVNAADHEAPRFRADVP